MVAAPSTLTLPDGRTLAYDDVGDPAGTPVVYLHGTPDSRLARPPDSTAGAAIGQAKRARGHHEQSVEGSA